MAGHTKINWQNYSDKIFEESARQNKPILLGISAVWCHWCHVMDKGTYADEKIADSINKNFIPVRVDTDKRPDINSRYNMGGWPTTAVLYSDGRIIDGATYMPPESMQGFLQRGIEIFRSMKENKIEVGEQSKKIGEFLEGSKVETHERVVADEEFLKSVESQIKEAFDEVNGGFGEAPKFPHADALNHLAFLARHEKNNEFKTMLLKTLAGMLEGEFFDREEFGFFRYCTQANWTVPHYEKMLEDNAQLISAYLDGYAIFREEKFKNTVLKCFDYLFENLFDKENKVFYGSQDADEEYYQKKLVERKGLPKPFVDKTIFTDWNSQMVSTLLKAFAVTGNDYYKKIAIECLENLLNNSFDGKAVYHYYPRDSETLNAILKDYACLLKAVIDTYCFTLDEKYLELTKKLYETIESKFYDSEKGGFFDIAKEFGGKGLVAEKHKLIPENSVMLNNMKKLQFLLDNPGIMDRIDQSKAALLPIAHKQGFFASAFAEAIAVESCFVEAKIIGKKDEPLFNEFHSRLLANYGMEIAIRAFGEEEAKEQGFSKTPVLSPCRAGLCLEPIYESDKIAKLFGK